MRPGTRNRRQRRAAARRLGRKRKSPALRALWSSAMALSAPAASVWADEPIDRYSAEYHYSTYSEDDLEASKGLAGGETSRYEIEMHQFSLRAPWRGRWDLAVDVVHETMSGASPQYVVPDAAGAPVQVMSGASISDERNDLLV
ncbi:MAG: hypothetical protein V3V67_05045, partial [Myxococcota bacterium]